MEKVPSSCLLSALRSRWFAARLPWGGLAVIDNDLFGAGSGRALDASPKLRQIRIGAGGEPFKALTQGKTRTLKFLEVQRQRVAIFFRTVGGVISQRCHWIVERAEISIKLEVSGQAVRRNAHCIQHARQGSGKVPRDRFSAAFGAALGVTINLPFVDAQLRDIALGVG